MLGTQVIFPRKSKVVGQNTHLLLGVARTFVGVAESQTVYVQGIYYLDYECCKRKEMRCL